MNFEWIFVQQSEIRYIRITKRRCVKKEIMNIKNNIEEKIIK